MEDIEDKCITTIKLSSNCRITHTIYHELGNMLGEYKSLFALTRIHLD